MNRFPRILCIYGNKVFYGHERSNVQVFCVFKELDVDFKVLVNSQGIHSEAQQLLDENKILYSSIVYPDWSDIRKPRSLKGWLRYFTKVCQHNSAIYREFKVFQPDLLYIANDFMFINLIPFILLTKIKILYRIGDAPVMGWPPFRFFWKNIIINRVTKFVYISEYIKSKVLAVGGRNVMDDQVIYNYPPIRSKNDKPPIPFRKTHFTFGYLGQIIEIKGVHLILQAAKKLKEQGIHDFHVLIAGGLDYDPSFSKALVDYAFVNQLNSNITFLGNIENIADFFSKIDVLITPSIKEEPLGNVIVEAKANAVPSIVFNSGGMPELIRHEIDGYVVLTKDGSALLEALLYFIENKESINMFKLESDKSTIDLSLDYASFNRKWETMLLGFKS